MKNCQICGKQLQDNEAYVLANGQEVCASCYAQINGENQKTEAFYQPPVQQAPPVQATPVAPVNPVMPAAPLYPPYVGEKIKKTNFWTGFLKVFAIIGLVLGILASIGGAIAMIVAYGRYNTGIAVLTAFGIFIGGVLISLVATASVMVYLNIASDVSTIKAALQELEQRNRK